MTSQLEAFFNIIHRYTPKEALIGLTTINGEFVTNRWYQRQFAAKLFEDIRAVGARANVYARITPLGRAPDNGRGNERLSLGSSVLFLDYDTYKSQADGLAALRAFPLSPTLIVNSGNGLHCYWLLDRFYSDIDELKARNKGLALSFGGKAEGGDSCFDLARVLRVPETFNVKGITPLECSIVEMHPDRVYTLDQFEAVPIEDVSIDVWDNEPLGAGFIEELRARDPKLVKRIVSEEGAKKCEAPTKPDGSIDRSRNDAFIATRLLSLGYTPGIALSVLMSPEWFSGAKFRERKRYDYCVMTVNAALRAFADSPDRYFAKASFIPAVFATELQSASRYIFAGETLWRYQDGVFLGDGVEFIKAQAIKRLGRRWSTRSRDELVNYVIDQSRVPIETINQHAGLINIRNGMLDLASGDILPHDPQYMSTAQLAIDFDPNADTTAIDRFIAAILPADTIALFWEYVGSMFIRDHYWPKAFLSIIGPRDCGKSKIIEFLAIFLGSANISTKTFQALADNRFATAALFGKLANLYDDLSGVEAQDVGLIKALTGDTRTIDAEEKFKRGFSFKNTARFVFTANDFIGVRNPDDAYFSRAHTIICSNVFTPATADPFIIDKMTTPANLSGALLRALEGLQRLRAQNTFTPSASIAAAGDAYRFTAETVSGFLHACEFDPQFFISKQLLYQFYRAACTQSGRKPVSEDKFFKRVAENAARFGMTDEYKMLDDGSRQWVYYGRKPRQLDTAIIMPQTLDLTRVN